LAEVSLSPPPLSLCLCGCAYHLGMAMIELFWGKTNVSSHTEIKGVQNNSTAGLTCNR
jgi:hypothetical protein